MWGIYHEDLDEHSAHDTHPPICHLRLHGGDHVLSRSHPCDVKGNRCFPCLTAQHLPFRYVMQEAERFAEPTSIQELRLLLRAIAKQVVETMVQPEYLDIFRLMLAELPRFPELGPLFRQTVPEPAINALLVLLRQGQAHGLVRERIELSTIGRMFFGT